MGKLRPTAGSHHMPKVTQLVGGRARKQTQASTYRAFASALHPGGPLHERLDKPG